MKRPSTRVADRLTCFNSLVQAVGVIVERSEVILQNQFKRSLWPKVADEKSGSHIGQNTIDSTVCCEDVCDNTRLISDKT